MAVLPGWPTGARVNAVTPDGAVLLADDGERGFRWVDGRGTELGVLPVSLWTYPVATSTDGVVVVGATNGGSAESFRWQDGHLVQFGSSVYPSDISADGRIIAGYRYNGRDANVAFRWRDGTLRIAWMSWRFHITGRIGRAVVPAPERPVASPSRGARGWQG